ncbi:hypothetical protein K1T35_47420 (plasmid) [Pseudonocardia sp. DSM 110487]|uniref:hypothetical protein n=1 Tax=Pseudonocardia sp. DSM 110487 TaxID=2865833 RepID=UPI001C6A3148|nr:hypothetical protein [Pseudonocardia sp. DSM 110487]QYN40980.1 hypothetical protein K1T35_47420 [Pseudonocardia sp. DSM 110487]
MVTNKATPDLFDAIRVGDRIETWDGVWGSVEDVEFHGRTVFDGSYVIFEATLRIASDNLRTFDKFGTPKSYSGVITRRIRKHSSDLRWAYTPEGN